jgi:hypothetical protein
MLLGRRGVNGSVPTAALLLAKAAHCCMDDHTEEVGSSQDAISVIKELNLA